MLVLKNNSIFKKTITDLFKALIPLLGILFITGLYIYTEVLLDASIFESYSNIFLIIALFNLVPYLLDFKKYTKKLIFSNSKFSLQIKNLNIYSAFLMVLSFFVLILISILKLTSVVRLEYSEYLYLFFNFENKTQNLSSNFLKSDKNLSLFSNNDFNKILNVEEFAIFYFKNQISLSQHYLENSIIFSYIFFIKKCINSFFDHLVSLTPEKSNTFFDFGAHINIPNFIREHGDVVVHLRNIINSEFISGSNTLWKKNSIGEIVLFINNNFFLDGVSLWLVWLVITVAYVISFSSYKKKIIDNNFIFKKYYIYNSLLNCILILMVVCFLVKDLFLFFIAFESILVPLFVYIILQGSRLNKIFAVKYLVVYTIIGSIFLWYAISYIVEILGVSNFDYVKWVILNSVSSGTRKVLFLSLFLGFAFKVPMVPFHHWLVIAHVEAPTNGSIILAALLLKVGGYGMYRFVYNIFPLEVFQFSNEIVSLAVFGFSYATVLAVRQLDIKRYIAYTSIAHMNFSLIGLFSCTEIGMLGYIHIMISHGVISTAMFYLIGHIYSILNFRDSIRLSGIAYKFPKFSMFFFIFSIANMGIPLFSGFPGEFFILTSLVFSNEFYAILVFLGFMFSGVYNFLQINKILFSGYGSSIFLKKNEDLDNVSILILFSLLFWSLVFGLFPDIITKNVEVGLFI